MPVVVLPCLVVGAALGPVLHHAAVRLSQREAMRPFTYSPPRTAEELATTVVTAGGFGAMAAEFDTTWALLPFLVLVAALVAVSVVDLLVKRIPDRLTFPTFTLSLALVTLVSLHYDAPRAVWYALVGAVGYFAILFLAHLVYPRGMGFGDVKLAAVMGLYLGWLAVDWLSALYLVVVALLVGCVLGVVLGLVLRAGFQREFPFGPALAVAALVVVVYADTLLRDYAV